MDKVKNNVFLSMSTHIFEKKATVISTDDGIWLHIENFSILFKDEWLRNNTEQMNKLADYINSAGQDKENETYPEDKFWCNDCKKYVIGVDQNGKDHNASTYKNIYCQDCGEYLSCKD